MPYKDKRKDKRWHKKAMAARRQAVRLKALALLDNVLERGGVGVTSISSEIVTPEIRHKVGTENLTKGVLHPKSGISQAQNSPQFRRAWNWALKQRGINPAAYDMVVEKMALMRKDLEATREHLRWYQDSKRYPDLAATLQEKDNRINELEARIGQIAHHLAAGQALAREGGYRGDGPLTPDELADHEDTMYHDTEVRE